MITTNESKIVIVFSGIKSIYILSITSTTQKNHKKNMSKM